MSQTTDRLFSRLALIGALAAAFALGACGRKGPLDPPPSAVSATGQQEPANTALIQSPFAKPGDATQAKAAKTEGKAGSKADKSFILDPLLN
ncbi:MAG: lipoprotein [Pseudolabrys sp.]